MIRWIAESFLRWNGWEPEGQSPTARKFVLIAAPHTSNWDLAYLLALSVRFDVKVHWMGKHSLFRGPMGWTMRRLGGIPIRRHLRENVVQQMVRQFEERDELCLTVPSEGTRGFVPYWKSGFYHIAVGAKVPIVPAFLDFGKKRAGFGPAIMPTGDVHVDMDTIRAFYEPMDAKGFRNDLVGPIRLREEEKTDA